MPAQVGSFVPAESARMHVFDSVHTRMGASDNLAMGRSTFLEARLSVLRALTFTSVLCCWRLLQYLQHLHLTDTQEFHAGP